MTTLLSPSRKDADRFATEPVASASLSLWIPPKQPLPAARCTTPPVIVVPPRRRARVLIADDDSTIVEITSLILQFTGYEVVVAEDGETAWRTYLDQGCDLLLTDQDMPRLSGSDLIGRIRSHGDKIPVILTSGRVASEEIPVVLRRQIDAVLQKPFSSDLLLHTIRACLPSQGS